MTVINLEYWPPISHVAQWYNSPELQVQPGGTYQKQSFLNRCKIAGVQGPLTLSVPLAGGREQKHLYREVRIDHSQRWAVQQLRTLQSCYGKAPFFDYYFPEIEKLLCQQVQYLQELNEQILNQLIVWLKWKGQVIRSDGFVSIASNPIDNFPSYVQVFADRQNFIPDMSVIDLLFCVGPASSRYFQQFDRHSAK